MTGSTRLRPGFDGDARADAQPAPPRWRATWAEVDVDAIATNTAVLKAHAAAPELMAVVKADGYGHGAVPAARAALRGGAGWLGVALVEEGEALRAGGIDAPVLLLSEPPVRAVPALLDAGLTPTVYTSRLLAALGAAGRTRGRDVDVHLKLDTGMHRVGVPEADWDDAFRAVAGTAGIRVQGLWSHLAVGDQPGHPFTEQQAASFDRGLVRAARAGLRWDIAHLCNSGGTILSPAHHHDLVRTGIAVYGIPPAPGIGSDLGLRPAMAWRSRLSLVKDVAAGEAVSYGLRWAAPAPTVVATLPAGYADGVVRALSNRGAVVWRGRRVPIVGTVTMDQVLLDLGADADAGVGDDVWLLGGDGGAEVTAEDWAAWLDTIAYEIVCGVGARVPRTYRGGA